MPFEPVVIGEIFPFEKPDPSFVGDDVHSAFGKLNTFIEDLEENGLPGGGGAGSDGGFIDTSVEYTSFFRVDLRNWTSNSGTLEIPDPLIPAALWTAPAGDYLYNSGTDIDTKRFTHLALTIERVSPDPYTPDQRATSKNASRGYDWSGGFSTGPLQDPTPLPVGEKKYLAFELSKISDWFSVGANGVQFRLSLDAGVYRIWGIKLVGPDSSEVNTASTQAQIAKDLAEAAEQSAKDWSDASQTFSQESQTYRDQSQGYASDSQTYRDQSSSFASASQLSAGLAQTAQTNAENAQTLAEAAMSQAQGFAGDAGNSATSASNSATSAAGSASDASGSASAAASSATTAASSADDAATSASNASSSATQAANSATDADGSAGQAATYATNASNSATAAGTSATAASNSASEAATSATNAGTSASQASTSASNAAASESAAGNSATAAAGSASAASTSASDAASYADAASENSLTAISAARFSHYLKPLPAGTFTFDTTIQGFTSNGTLTAPGGALRAVISSLSGYVQTPNIDFQGSSYSKIMIRMKWISGTLPTIQLSDCVLLYSTVARGMDTRYQMKPFAWETLVLNDQNIVNLYFDATEQSGTLDDWFGASLIRNLRFYPAQASNPITFELEYFYVLGEDVNYPYVQAQAAATSASQASAFENDAQQWASAASTSATDASTSAGAASTSAGQAATSATTAEGWSTSAQSYAILSAQASPGLSLTKNPIFMEWTTTTLPVGLVSLNQGTTTITKNTTNAIYSPQCIDVNAPASGSTLAAIGLNSDDATSRLLALDSRYYILEGVLELVSGALSNFVIRLEKNFTDSTQILGPNITPASFTPLGSNRYAFSSLHDLETPAGKTLSRIAYRLYYNSPSLSAKRFLVHKLAARLATPEEIATGNVQDLIDASVSQEASLRIAGDDSIEGKYGVKINANGYVTGYGLIATANNDTPTSEMIFQVDKFKVSTAGQTPKQMFAVGQVNGTTTLVLNGNMIADGTLTARSLVISDFNNLVPDSDFGGQTWTIDSEWAYGQLPTGVADQRNSLIYTKPVGATGLSSPAASGLFPIKPNAKYLLTGRFYADQVWSGAVVRINYYDSNKASLGTFSTSLTPNSGASGTVVDAQVNITTPTNASYATYAIYFSRDGSPNGTKFYVTQPYVREMFGGNVLIDGAVTAEKMSVTQLSAISGDFGDITAGSININGKFVLENTGEITISSATTGQRMVITSSLIQVFDSSNVERVKLGIW